MTALAAVLAGGRGRRMGGAKALVRFDGEPLIAWPIAAAMAADLDVVVVAKAETALPPLGVPVWQEPDEPVHPLLGVVTVLERAGRPVLAIACDMPFLTSELVARLAAGPEAAVTADGRLAPFPARYEPAALPALRAALAREAPLRETLAALEPVTIAVDDARVVASVNTPEEPANA
ncbi:MAG TPA: NTP transferase domain-containing protein [Solirubrobacteraceae bacterium]|nr:NTP transferase domain-containing protein [Solirubrobacteraceae bacterium]